MRSEGTVKPDGISAGDIDDEGVVSTVASLNITREECIRGRDTRAVESTRDN